MVGRLGQILSKPCHVVSVKALVLELSNESAPSTKLHLQMPLATYKTLCLAIHQLHTMTIFTQ